MIISLTEFRDLGVSWSCFLTVTMQAPQPPSLQDTYQQYIYSLSFHI